MLDRIPKLPPKIQPLLEDMNRPLWSIMIPSYNCINYLSDTIKSVLLQATCAEEMQIEVIDDCSTDGDIETLVNELGDHRVSFFRQPENVGNLRNYETCINRAKGKLIHILHGDDVVKPGFYQEIFGLFKKYPDIGAAFTHSIGFKENNVVLWNSPQILDNPGIIDNWLLKIAEGQKLQTPCMVVKRNVYESLGSFFGVESCEDWEMWTRIAMHYKVAYSPKTLAHYRVHTNNVTGKAFATGQNIKDIITVINIIQDYLPKEYRKTLKIKAIRIYTSFITDTAFRLYQANDPKTALLQIWEAFKLYPNIRTLYYLLKIRFNIPTTYKWKCNFKKIK
jgi:glycosyltransferase involved in cell wall biosynthesis